MNPPAACASPIDAAVLADYWLAALPESDEQAVEEHLFTCDPCGARLRGIIALAGAVRALARSGSLRLVVSDHFLQRAAAEGLRVREYAPPPGSSVHCTVTAGDDLLIARLAVDLADTGPVDLQFFDETGAELHTIRDIPVNPAAREVVYQESMTFAKAAPDNTLVVRLVSGSQTLGEYTFHHTRSLPPL